MNEELHLHRRSRTTDALWCDLDLGLPLTLVKSQAEHIFSSQLKKKRIHSNKIKTSLNVLAKLHITNYLCREKQKMFCPWEVSTDTCWMRLKTKFRIWVMVVAQLEERSLPTPETCGSNPNIGKIYL